MKYIKGALLSIAAFATKAFAGPISFLAYLVVGGVIFGLLIVAEFVSFPAEAIKDRAQAFPGAIARVFEYTGRVDNTTGTDVNSHIVGQARFQVLTSGLVRVEYAEDKDFEDRPTMLAFNRNITPPPYNVSETETTFTITTSKLTLTYTKNSGAFNDENLKITVHDADNQATVSPTWLSKKYQPQLSDRGWLGYLNTRPPEVDTAPATQGNLGGWYRSLDSQSGAVPLHDGLLSRDGYYFIDDSRSAVLVDNITYQARPFHTAKRNPGQLLTSALNPNTKLLEGAYQDGYFFAYGTDYKAALMDYRTLSGSVPLLPRKAFGVWYSKWFPYTDSDYRNELFPTFREEQVPLDVLVIDTDAKAPLAWNGWNWNTDLLPDPQDTISWMHGQGVDVLFNIHPSIARTDPKYASTVRKVGKDRLNRGASTYFASWGFGVIDPDSRQPENITGVPYVFNFEKPSHVQAFMDLHDEFERDGIDGFWIDWCCDDASVGGNIYTGEFAGDIWLNQIYAQRNFARGSRWLTLGRSGGSFQDWHGNRPGPWGAHRSTIHFTGDTLATWEMLDFQARFAAAEGGVGMPYVSHDVGGFQLNKLFGNDVTEYDEQLYVRWVQLAAFQPILRLHASNTVGSERLPWEFEGQIKAVSADFLRLRSALIPYLYSTARESHDTGLPMVRAMYLDWPQQEAAYTYDRQYMLGSQLLVAPIGTPADEATGLASKKVWFPPNSQWVDIFTGQVYAGGTQVTVQVPLERIPVFAKAGAILPLAPYMDYSEQKPLNNLKLSVFTGQNGAYSLYEDDGAGLDYLQNKFARTSLSYNSTNKELSISASIGTFNKKLTQRAYQLKVVNANLPSSVTVSGVNLSALSAAPNDSSTTPGWYYDAAARVLYIQTAQLSTNIGQVVRF